MITTRLESLKIKAKLLQKAKLKAGKPIQLKVAFEMLAKHAGFRSWRDMKENIEANEFVAPKPGGAYWNVWYSSYEEAVEHLTTMEGYLLPYQKHFFICDINYIENLGIDRANEDLKLVGNNWVAPKDAAAMKRLRAKIK